MNEPKRPLLVACLFFVGFVLLLGYPLLSGEWLAGPHSDQVGGFAVRQWAAEQWRATGAVPLWNPMIFGGLPYVATLGHGDVFYPLSFLRLIVTADIALGVWFVVHTILAGVFMYLLLRRLGVAWLGCVAGGIAYQLSGILISLPSPGHDGKLAVSAIMPLALFAVLAAVRDRRWWGYGLLSVVVALSLLSPHVQMTYYLLLASGAFALYCAFGEPGPERPGPRVARLALALGAVLVGFGVAAPQLLPFLEYVPHSPRAESYRDFAGSASYAIPWNHVPEFFIAGWSGEGATYWGSNPLKLHSEYLGLPVIGLAIFGVAGAARRRLVLWLGGIALLFLLVSLGASTPFYRLWWSVMPYVKQTRAPGMAFFMVSCGVAVFAALGVERLLKGDGPSVPKIWLIAGGVVALLGVAGVFGTIASSAAPAERVAGADAHGDAIRIAALLGGLALAAMGALALAWRLGRVPARGLAVLLPLLVGADLWRDGRRFWSFQPPATDGIYRADALVERVRQTPLPYRVLDITALAGAPAYPLNVLQGHGVPQTLGYFGFEHRYYDELLGGKDEWRYLLASTRLWNLLAISHVITPDTMQIPGYRLVLGPVMTGSQRAAYLYEADSVPPYARVVPAAVKLEEERTPGTVNDPRLPGFDRVVFLPPAAPVDVPALAALPDPSPARARITAWRPGAMTVQLDPAPPADAFLLVAENWYLDWHATVDGRTAPVLRGNNSLITVPVAAGARQVELVFRSASYRKGKWIAAGAIVLILASIALPPLLRRRATRPA